MTGYLLLAALLIPYVWYFGKRAYGYAAVTVIICVILDTYTHMIGK